MQIAKQYKKSAWTMLWSIALLLAMVCLASCSKDDDVIDIPDQPETSDNKPISFSGSMPDDQSVTRASGLEDSQTTFTVYGYKNDAYDSSTGSYTSYQTVFPGFTVNYGANTAYTSTSNTSDWEYVGITAEQTIKYWDWGANAYRFFAYALGNGTNPTSVTASAPTSASSTSVASLSAMVDASSDATIANAPYFSRLWFSTGNSTKYPDKQFGQPVTLEFLKPFARVRFIFTLAEGVNINRSQLNGIEFKPTNTSNKIATAGTVTVTYPLTGTATTETWATTETSTIDEFTIDYYEADDTYTPDDTNTATVYDNTPQKWYTVLPQSLGAFTVYVQVVTTDIKTAIVPAEYMDWKAGYEYTYKFKILKGGGITLDIIQVAINQWGTDHAISHPVYNW